MGIQRKMLEKRTSKERKLEGKKELGVGSRKKVRLGKELGRSLEKIEGENKLVKQLDQKGCEKEEVGVM